MSNTQPTLEVNKKISPFKELCQKTKELEKIYNNTKLKIIAFEENAKMPRICLKINNKITLRENFIEYIAYSKSKVIRKIYKDKIKKIDNIELYINDIKKIQEPIGNLGFTKSLKFYIQICLLTSIHPNDLLSILENINQGIKEFRYKSSYNDAGEKLQYLPSSRVIFPKNTIGQGSASKINISTTKNKTKVSQK